MEVTKLLHNTFRFHRTDYRNCSVYTARNIIVPFTPHGLTTVNFHLHRMEITKLLYNTFRFHRTDYRNCSVYTAWNTIVPFTPHGFKKKIPFTPHGDNKTSPYHFPFTPHGIQNPSVFTVRNTIVPFTPNGLAKVIVLFTPHGNNVNFSLSLHALPKFTSAYSQHGLTKLFRFHRTD